MLTCSFHVRFRQAASATLDNVYKKNGTIATRSPTEKTLILLLLIDILLQAVVLQRAHTAAVHEIQDGHHYGALSHL